MKKSTFITLKSGRVVRITTFPGYSGDRYMADKWISIMPTDSIQPLTMTKSEARRIAFKLLELSTK